MPLSNVSGRYYQSDSDFPRSISWQQLLALHVAANYKLHRSQVGWTGYKWPDARKIHCAATIKSLLKSGLLEGNARGENIAMGIYDEKSLVEHPIPVLWTSPKGKKLLDKINKERGITFDKENCELTGPDTVEADGLVLGHFATKREAALAYDRAARLNLNSAEADKKSAVYESGIGPQRRAAASALTVVVGGKADMPQTSPKDRV
jgi:hypothetical protein